MFEEWNDGERDEDGGQRIFVSQTVLERIIMEQGGDGTTHEDAIRYLDQLGADLALVSLMWIRIETFRERFGRVLDRMEQYVVRHPQEDMLDMAADAQTILAEFIELCEMAGLVESQRVYVAYDDEV